MKRTLSLLRLVALFCVFIAMNPTTSYAQITHTAGIVYVTPNGTGNGSSWGNATSDLQGAIDATGASRVFVAIGNYDVPLPNSFVMKNGVAIYGGFDPANNILTLNDVRILPVKGASEGSVLNGRNEKPVIWNDGNSLNTSAILDGFTIKNGYHPGGEGGGIHNVGSSPALRNLVIKNNSAAYGGGVYNNSSSPFILNCIFTKNSATSFGGGLHNSTSSSPLLNNCLFTGNSASTQGGGVYNLSGHGTFINVTLANNGGNGFLDFAGTYWKNSIIWDVVWWGSTYTATYSLIQGAASTADGNLDATGITLTDIFNDPANGDYTLAPASPALDKGDNWLNTTQTDLAGKARYVNSIVDLGPYEYPGYPTALYVKETATGNGSGTSWANATADLQAAINTAGVEKVYVATGRYDVPSPHSFVMQNGVEIYGGFNPVNNITDWDTRTLPNKGMGDGSVLNGKKERAVIWNNNNGLTASAVLDGFTITEGKDSNGGGITNYSVSPTFRNLVIRNNEATTAGGGIYNNSAGINLSNSIIKDNIAPYGGGVYNNGSASVLTNVAITGNSATLSTTGAGGGGIFNQNSALVLTNVQITGNSTNFLGGGFHNLSGNPVLTNVTLANNTAVNNTATAAMHIAGGSPQVNNSIIYGAVSGSYDVRYSLVEGSSSTDNENLDATGATLLSVFADYANGNYTLKPISPAINAGNNSLYAGLGAHTGDLAGSPRVYDFANGGIIDLGAYEYQGIPLFPDANGIVYVREGFNGNGSGWTKATGDLQGAIDAEDVHQVFVAVGNYNAPANSFVMKNNVEIYGGFDPANEIETLDDNRILPTGTVSGSVLNGENERTVVRNDNNFLNSSAILDGFTITNAYTDGSGGGIYSRASSPSYRNLVIIGNTAGNSGGGASILFGTPAFTNVQFIDNKVTFSSGLGGAIYINSGYSPALTNVVFTGNHASYGGAIFNSESSAVLTNCLIFGNTSNNSSGIYSSSTRIPELTNVTVTDDMHHDVSPLVNNSIIYGDLTGESLNARYSLIKGNTNTADGNLDATGITAPDIFTDPANSDYTLKSGSPVINKGSNALFSGLDENTRDLAGNTRLFGPAIDIGAYEYQGADALPVRWISFEGRLSDQRRAVLTWKTEEANVSHYEVERSANAEDFRIAGTVTAGGTGPGSYSLTDPVPVSGTIYYRIRQVDLDGTFSYSRIISLTSEGNRELVAWPNPARDRVMVQLAPGYIGTKVRLVSPAGIVLEQVDVNGEVCIIDVSRYAPGIYLLQTYDGKTIKLIRE